MGKNKPRVRLAKSPVRSTKKVSREEQQTKTSAHKLKTLQPQPPITPQSPVAEFGSDSSDDGSTDNAYHIWSSSGDEGGLSWPMSHVHLFPEVMFVDTHPHPPIYAGKYQWSGTQHVRDTLLQCSETFDHKTIDLKSFHGLLKMMYTGNADWELNFAQIADLYERFLQQYCDECHACQRLDKKKEVQDAAVQVQNLKKLKKRRKVTNAAAAKAYQASIADFESQHPFESTIPRPQSFVTARQYNSTVLKKPVIKSSFPHPPTPNAVPLDLKYNPQRPVPSSNTRSYTDENLKPWESETRSSKKVFHPPTALPSSADRILQTPSPVQVDHELKIITDSTNYASKLLDQGPLRAPNMSRILFHSHMRDENGNILSSTPVTVGDYYNFFGATEAAVGSMSTETSPETHLPQESALQQTDNLKAAQAAEAVSTAIEDRDERVEARHAEKAQKFAETLFASGAAKINISDYLGSAPLPTTHTEPGLNPSSWTGSTEPSIIYHGMVLATFSSIGVDPTNFEIYFPHGEAVDRFFDSLAEGRKPLLNLNDAEWTGLLARNLPMTKKAMLLRWQSFSQGMFDVYGSKHKDGCGKKGCKDCGISESSRSHARELAREEIKALLESKGTKGTALNWGGVHRGKVDWSKKANSQVLLDRNIKPLPKRHTGNTLSFSRSDTLVAPDTVADPESPATTKVPPHHTCAPNFDFVMPKSKKKAASDCGKLSKLVESIGKTYLAPYMKAGIDMLTISWFLSDVESGLVDKNSAGDYSVGEYDKKHMKAMWAGIALEDKGLKK